MSDVNERLALALGWTHHPSYAGYMVPPTGIPETWGMRDITPPDYLTGDGMLVVLEVMRERGYEVEIVSFTVFKDHDFEVQIVPVNENGIRCDPPEMRTGNDLPALVAECALAVLEGALMGDGVSRDILPGDSQSPPWKQIQALEERIRALEAAGNALYKAATRFLIEQQDATTESYTQAVERLAEAQAAWKAALENTHD